MRFPGIKIYRKIRYRKGFGVHSPFVYNLITKVIEEKSHYYVFEEIEKFRNDLLKRDDYISDITEKETQTSNYGALLFRLMNFFKFESVLQIGCSTGVISLYLATYSPTKNNCFLLEERIGLLNFVKDFCVIHHLDKVHIFEGNYEESIKKIHSCTNSIDLIFINQPGECEAEKIMLLCEPFIKNKSILIFNDIHKNKEIKKLWQEIRSHKEIRLSIDLYSIGLAFFDEKVPKKHYKAYFNHGKKQNIYKKRRRGLYLIGRRKKSSQNKSSY